MPSKSLSVTKTETSFSQSTNPAKKKMIPGFQGRGIAHRERIVRDEEILSLQ
jgi:hypothetical protein